jgi:hypothetical protein
MVVVLRIVEQEIAGEGYCSTLPEACKVIFSFTDVTFFSFDG